MGLEQQLAAFKAEFARTGPAGRRALYEAKIEELRASFAMKEAIGIDDQAPDFRLPDAQGKPVSLPVKQLDAVTPLVEKNKNIPA